MTDNEFDTFLQKCLVSLGEKQRNLIKIYNLWSWHDFLFDQESRCLKFRHDDTPKETIFDIVVIWSYWKSDKIWKWWWANKNLTKELQDDAEKIMKLYTDTKLDIFLKPHFNAEANMVDEIISMSVETLDSLWSYKVPTEYGYLFLSVMNER